MTIKEFLEEIIRVFKKAGVECAETEARLLACHVLSCSPAFLVSHADDEMDDKVLLASAALINERCKGRPIQYVLGSANFYGIDLAVDERVLIPRPETELLAEEAIAFLKERPFPKAMDLCTGSGAIAAAVAANVPNVKVIATDMSPKAFMLARVNLRPYHCRRASFLSTRYSPIRLTFRRKSSLRSAGKLRTTSRAWLLTAARTGWT